MSHTLSLENWFRINTVRPVYITISLLMAALATFLVAEVYRLNQDLKETSRNLSNVISVGLFQRNRLLIETSSTYALASSEIRQICIFENTRLLLAMPNQSHENCSKSDTFVEKNFDVFPKAVPQFTVRFKLPRFPGMRAITLYVFPLSILVLAVFCILSYVTRKVRKDLITQIAEQTKSISSTDFMFSRTDTGILELNELIQTYKVRVLEIKNLTDKEAELKKQAEIGSIFAQLTHDLRSALGVFERLLLIQPTDFGQMKSSIKDALNRLYAMFEAIRHSEIESIVSPTPSVISFAFGKQSLLAKSQKLGIQLLVPEEQIGPLQIDVTKFERAWINLVSNAIDAAKSVVKVEVHLDEQIFLLRVTDDGPGVPQPLISKLFQRGATYGKAGGTGLGLAFVKQIMLGHGGDVTYNRENGSTVFECYIPQSTLRETINLENQAGIALRQELKQIVKVAICLEPPELSDRVIDGLRSYNSGDFFFSKERADAKLVVSNQAETMLEVLERDDQEYLSVAQLRGDRDKIVALIARKLQIG